MLDLLAVFVTVECDSGEKEVPYTAVWWQFCPLPNGETRAASRNFRAFSSSLQHGLYAHPIDDSASA